MTILPSYLPKPRHCGSGNHKNNAAADESQTGKGHVDHRTNTNQSVSVVMDPSEEQINPMSSGGLGMGDWTRHQDEVTGYWYLSNSVTGETKWEEQGSD